MKKNYIYVIIAVILGIFLGWLFFGGSSNETSHKGHNHSAEESKNTIWTCSMHPQIRKNEPGKCPICGMDLIPLAEEESAVSENSIKMSEYALKLAEVNTMVVSKSSMDKELMLYGKVQADERLIFTQSSHIPGRIENLLIDYTGQYVKKGQTIASVYSPELVTAQKELFEAQKVQDEQPELFEAAKRKLKYWKLTDNEIDEILNSKEIKEIFPIKADVSGYVIEKLVNLGDYLKKGQSLYTIADLTNIWVLFDVYESDIPWVKVGDKIEYTIQSLPGKTFKGRVTYIDPFINPHSRVAKARVETINKGNLLKPEMFASAKVYAKLPNNSKKIIVPKSAIMWTGKRSIVYVKNKQDNSISFDLREVTLGPSLGDSYVIENGLNEGEEIAVNGTFSIDAAAQLSGKPSMMSPKGGNAMTGHNHGAMNGSSMKNMDKDSQKESVKSGIKLKGEAKKQLLNILDKYFDFKDYLTKDDFKKSKSAAVKLKDVVNNIDMNVFKDDAHKIWMKFSKELSKSIEHAHHTSDIEELRTMFEKFSNNLIKFIKNFEVENIKIYVQHCPMAFDNKGADWLSKDKEIVNPYFGSMMLLCGEVIEVIK